SGNKTGVFLDSTTNNLVQGNYIGTNTNGSAAIPNTNTGVIIADGNGNTIGGTTAGAGNVISGNGVTGVWLDGSSTSNVVQGNLIGTRADGSNALGNGLHGVRITNGAQQNLIGGIIGAGNIIAFNEVGVEITSAGAIRNAILSNSIFANTFLGIDLDGDGVTP